MNKTGMPEGYTLQRKGCVTVLVREDLAGCVEGLGVFGAADPLSWKGADGSFPGGRGRPTRVQLATGSTMVVKAMLRGGVLGPLNRRFHLTAARLVREARLSSYLLESKVPVPAMLLGRAERLGFLFNQLHIGFEEIPQARDLHSLFLEDGRDEHLLAEVMGAAGRAVRSLHDAGVYHNDLNFTNLLAVPGDGGRVEPGVWIIDLDRSKRRDRLARRSRSANLARLFRHAVKNNYRHSVDLDRLWRCLLDGYCEDAAEASRLDRDVERCYRRSHLFHRISWTLQGR